MSELKRISADAVARATTKAERYRMLNEPWSSESICRDILEADPGNQGVAYLLLLSIADQFSRDKRVREADAEAVLSLITDPYRKTYYAGVIAERWAKRLLRAEYGADAVLGRLRRAMELYEEAERLSPEANDDAMLRWNTCQRLIERFNLEKGDQGSWDLHQIEQFDDEMPAR